MGRTGDGRRGTDQEESRLARAEGAGQVLFVRGLALQTNIAGETHPSARRQTAREKIMSTFSHTKKATPDGMTFFSVAQRRPTLTG
ncbi:hypothetical protein, partial [Chryseomicrobium aureum]|uniref:hypothetical protein n=1 Tax=Chryseomicrobium aureum TaxID=1441723 RepID=UPI00195E4423